MNIKYRAALLAIFFLIICHGIPRAETVNMSEEELTEFVKKVIRENPRLIYEAVNDYIQKMRRDRAKKQLSEKELKAIMKKRVKDAVRPHNPVLGPENASVTVIEYTDFQCPYCAKGDEMFQSFIDKYPGKLRIVFKNYPLKSHKQSNAAASAAMAAHKQGKFWEYHDLLFQASPEIDEESISLFAEMVSLDLEKFNSDRNSDEIKEWIKQDRADAKKLDISKTPCFILNGVFIGGVMNEKNFEAVIERLISESEKLEKKP